ncbi:hypothetical protein FB567DRAFT_577401 [Paraphoma chrysanthemicola]|uniref:Uncharacterized protein n=1 Tax=Paraphoma chrysanthemicola TaxID=798071 RepID=A0A8K0RCI9_9PLEO|nr:hypothetical protein FB567DRAFT_577401 [Paraphoma chrysanthemicola]
MSESDIRDTVINRLKHLYNDETGISELSNYAKILRLLDEREQHKEHVDTLKNRLMFLAIKLDGWLVEKLMDVEHDAKKKLQVFDHKHPVCLELDMDVMIGVPNALLDTVSDSDGIEFVDPASEDSEETTPNILCVPDTSTGTAVPQDSNSVTYEFGIQLSNTKDTLTSPEMAVDKRPAPATDDKATQIPTKKVKREHPNFQFIDDPQQVARVKKRRTIDFKESAEYMELLKAGTIKQWPNLFSLETKGKQLPVKHPKTIPDHILKTIQENRKDKSEKDEKGRKARACAKPGSRKLAQNKK